MPQRVVSCLVKKVGLHYGGRGEAPCTPSPSRIVRVFALLHSFTVVVTHCQLTQLNWSMRPPNAKR